MTFVEKLLSASRTNRSLVCVGLDPDPALMPVKDVFEFNKAIIDATADLVCVYKPNIAFYEAMGIDGLMALEKTVKYIPKGIPIICDAKRGDIGNTSKAYARALFETMDFDAATVNPYLGHDSLDSFLQYGDKGVIILCKTSNPGSADFQELEVKLPGTERSMKLYEMVAEKALEWNTRGNVGLVVGATFPSELERVREICPDLFILIPGIGAQAGDLEGAVKSGVDAQGEKAIISSSRQILYASKGKDYASAARKAALKLRDDINSIRN